MDWKFQCTDKNLQKGYKSRLLTAFCSIAEFISDFQISNCTNDIVNVTHLLGFGAHGKH